MKTQFINEGVIVPGDLIYEGINYKVYKGIVKEYRCMNEQEMRELLKTLDIERHLCDSFGFLTPLCYQIKQNYVYTQYQEYEQFRMVNDLYDMVGQPYFDDNLFIETLLRLYDLELQGIRLNLKASNCFIVQGGLNFQDVYFSSDQFETSLEQYLLKDFIKQRNIQNGPKQLALIFVSIWQKQYPNHNFKETNSPELLSLLDFMQKTITFNQVLQSQEFIAYSTPLNQTKTIQMKKAFEEKQIQVKNDIWDRIAIKMDLDQQTQLFDQPFICPSPATTKQLLPKLRKEYNFLSINVVKVSDSFISGCLIHDKDRRSVIISTIDGSIHVWDSELSTQKCCKNIRSITKYKSDILFAGDEGIVYSHNDGNPATKLKQESKILSLQYFNNQLITGDDSGVIRFYDLEYQLLEQVNAHKDRVKLYIFDILISSGGRTVILWGEQQITLVQPTEISCLLKSGDQLYIFTKDSQIRTYAQNSFIYSQKLPSIVESGLTMGNFLILGDQTGNMSIYCLQQRAIIYSQKLHLGSVTFMNWYSRSAKRIISIGRDNITRLSELCE